MPARTVIAVVALIAANPAIAADTPSVREGTAAYGSWRDDAPGARRRLRANDLPDVAAQQATVGASPSQRAKRGDRVPSVPAGFAVELVAEGLDEPRTLRVAPNGDVFLAETGGGRVLVYRPGADGKLPAQPAVFAKDLREVYGIAFFPPGPDPTAVYVSQPDRVLRFAYRNGDTVASAAPSIVVKDIPGGGHSTRDLAAPDAKRLLVAVGSASNVAKGMPRRSTEDIAAFERTRLRGAAWGDEDRRAAVWTIAPDGSDARLYATGLRNCAGMAVQPATKAAWCVVNERDGLGNDLPFEYATRVRAGGFYGWPWYYIGAHADPRWPGERADLKDEVIVPDVLIQAHSAPLGIAFYEGPMFPADYRGDAFVTLRGSWNRVPRTGYKVVRLRFANGAPTGEYVDFMTGFVVDDMHAWGRPTGVAVARDGSLLVSEDQGGTLWRVTATRN
ncbi:MAG: PQQ-dependent sugar dehydrogenase [Dokdonella sp.]|uniref:PQQ-dependent sugar dehydrogenase n=1 Tax=Dokdonella sp. TaxID=2291710 RepID=UPI003F802A37